MGLESGTYIDDLNVNNPAATDGLAQADDHLRLLKSTIKNTFPNVSAAVTPTHTQLNYLGGGVPVTSSVQEQLNAKTALDGVTSNIQTQLAAKQAINANNTARGYTSTTALWPASGTTATLAHGLGAFPSFVKVFCENVNASSSFGWTAGERFQISSYLDGSGANARGCSISFNATNVYISIPPAGLFFLSNTSGSISPLAAATWTSVSSGPAGSAPNFRLIVNAYT